MLLSSWNVQTGHMLDFLHSSIRTILQYRPMGLILLPSASILLRSQFATQTPRSPVHLHLQYKKYSPLTVTPAGQTMTHITGAPGTGNAVIDGTGHFAGATGTAHLSGMVNLSGFGLQVGDPISFDCLFELSTWIKKYYNRRQTTFLLEHH